MEQVNRKPNWVRGSCIGRGSFGTVSLAVKKSDGRIFTVKSVERSPGDQDCQLEALENEIRVLRSVSSPYIVEYLGDDVTCESGTRPCRNLHMEYLPGGTVAELGKYSGVDEMSLRSYAWCVVSALRYVHAKGIVHCDVKGRNVLVGPSPGTAKLADFGSATELSAPISPRGSPLWMAPEVVRGEYQGPESDVWSFGCTVIEMVTGKPAWEDRGADTLLQIGYSGDLPKFPAQLSELGRDFLDKCLRREPDKRWSCNQLLQHPFLLFCSPDVINTTKRSPRCVLDWSDSNFSDEDENEEETCRVENSNIDAKGRIEKLASKIGANWESDGWVEVRNLVTETTAKEERRTNSAYPDLTRTEEENSETSSEYSDSISIGIGEVSWRANWEYSDSNSSSSYSRREPNSDYQCSSTAGSSCRRENISYSCYQNVVLLLNLFVYCHHTLLDNINYKKSFTF